MLIGEHEIVAEVRLFYTSNGGSIGMGWGEFVTPDDYKDKKYFTSGEWMYFDKNYSTKKADFKKGKKFIFYIIKFYYNKIIILKIYK